MGKKLLLIGGGGHCHSVLDSVIASQAYEKVGIIDQADNPYLGVPVIGTDEDLLRLFNDGWTDAFITVGSVGSTDTRRRLYTMVKEIGFTVPTIVDPTSIIGNGTNLMEGTFVGKRAIINACCSIGTCAIINSGAVVEHDCKVGAFSHISPGAILCGQVSVGDDTHVGAGSTVRQLITIGEHALVGAGSVVVKDLPPRVKAYGNPCKVAR